MGENVVDDPEAFENLVKNLNNALSKKGTKDKSVKTTRKLVRTLTNNCLPRAMKYKIHLETIGQNRNSMSKTDPDATFMRMKEDHMKNGQLKPGYNVQIGTENQFIVGFSIHPKAGEAYVKYNMFHKEQKTPFKENPFRKENMAYDAEKDEYTCFHGRKLNNLKTIKRKSSSGYSSQLRVYECEDCSECPHREKCTKSKEWNRRIEVNVRLEELKQEARQNLMSEVGIALRKRRCIEPIEHST